MNDKIFIPNLGFEFKLKEDWSFRMFAEGRNNFYWNNFFPEYTFFDSDEYDKDIKSYDIRGASQNYYRAMHTHEYQEVTLLKGTHLKVSRIYIRKGAADYDSVTFSISKAMNNELKNKKEGGTYIGRRGFWAKLDDVNNIYMEKIIE